MMHKNMAYVTVAAAAAAADLDNKIKKNVALIPERPFFLSCTIILHLLFTPDLFRISTL